MASDTTVSALKGKTIVIADDDDLTRGLLRSVLRVIGANVVVEVGDGEQALEAVGRLKPQIVCLDIEMPGLSGLEVLTRIRADDAEVIVLMISAASSGANVRQALGARADGFIAKPFSAAKISQEIERALARRAAAAK